MTVIGNCYLGSPGISLFWLSLYLLAYFFWSSFMGSSAIKSFIFTWFHLISLHLTFLFLILKSIYTLKSLLVLKLLVLTAFSVDFTAECLTGISSSSFVEVNSVLPFQFSVSVYCTFQWMYYYPCSPSNWKHRSYLKFFFVDQYLKTEIITISVFIDHLCCTSIVLNVYI